MPACVAHTVPETNTAPCHPALHAKCDHHPISMLGAPPTSFPRQPPRQSQCQSPGQPPAQATDTQPGLVRRCLQPVAPLRLAKRALATGSKKRARRPRVNEQRGFVILFQCQFNFSSAGGGGHQPQPARRAPTLARPTRAVRPLRAPPPPHAAHPLRLHEEGVRGAGPRVSVQIGDARACKEHVTMNSSNVSCLLPFLSRASMEGARTGAVDSGRRPPTRLRCFPRAHDSSNRPTPMHSRTRSSTNATSQLHARADPRASPTRRAQSDLQSAQRARARTCPATAPRRRPVRRSRCPRPCTAPGSMRTTRRAGLSCCGDSTRSMQRRRSSNASLPRQCPMRSAPRLRARRAGHASTTPPPPLRAKAARRRRGCGSRRNLILAPRPPRHRASLTSWRTIRKRRRRRMRAAQRASEHRLCWCRTNLASCCGRP